jgi:hypothetical protein
MPVSNSIEPTQAIIIFVRGPAVKPIRIQNALHFHTVRKIPLEKRPAFVSNNSRDSRPVTSTSASDAIPNPKLPTEIT